MENPRRTRFIAWYKANYAEGSEGRAQFMKDTGEHGDEPLTKGRVSHFFDPKQAFGEAAARNLALRLGLDEDFFLRELSPRAYDAGMLLDSVTDEALKARIYSLWSQVHTNLTQGMDVTIVTAVPAATPHVAPAPKPKRAGSK